MRKIATALVLMVFAATPAFAEPLPWNYTVRYSPADGADYILLAQENQWSFDPVTGLETSRTVYVLNRGSVGPISLFRTGQTGFETTDLFGFGNGDWFISDTLPANTVANRFRLDYSIGGFDPVTGSVEGSIYASALANSGTGNFTIGLSDERDIDVDGQRAKLIFGNRESESYNRITMTLSPNAVDTPEPGTSALAGIGIAGLLGFRFRRRIAG